MLLKFQNLDWSFNLHEESALLLVIKSSLLSSVIGYEKHSFQRPVLHFNNSRTKVSAAWWLVTVLNRNWESEPWRVKGGLHVSVWRLSTICIDIPAAEGRQRTLSVSVEEFSENTSLSSFTYLPFHAASIVLTRQATQIYINFTFIQQLNISSVLQGSMCRQAILSPTSPTYKPIC